jgi:predicted benzoate:H+ symporter BenE
MEALSCPPVGHDMHAEKQKQYGWVVVAAAFTLMFVGFGAAYSFAAFFTAFESEFGASRGGIALVFSLLNAALLFWRIRIEDQALGPRRTA